MYRDAHPGALAQLSLSPARFFRRQFNHPPHPGRVQWIEARRLAIILIFGRGSLDVDDSRGSDQIEQVFERIPARLMCKLISK
jgi:hypothetical protein